MKENFKKGINLGGWLSQYDINELRPFTSQEMTEHLASFITEADIARIKSWGADHVRLPFAAWILEEEKEPWTEKAEGFYYLDECVRWCEKYDLNIILDLHEIEGHIYCADGSVIPLLGERKLQEHFCALWEHMAEHYRKDSTITIMFELLNEVMDGSGGYLWNRLWKEAAERIWHIDPDRPLLVGSNMMNHVEELKGLELLSDERIIYNFHFYEPQTFTHQKAHFSDDMRAFNQTVHYPGRVEGLYDFVAAHPEYQEKYRSSLLEKDIDRKLLEKLLQPVRNFARYSGCPLYCGEFGVIDQIDVADAARYLEDFTGLLKEMDIGYAYWNYKEMDFGIMTRDGQLRAEEVIRAVF